VNSDGKRWRVKLSEAIARVESGEYVFFIENSAAQKVELLVANDALDHKYLKAATDKEQPESLLSLPSCP